MQLQPFGPLTQAPLARPRSIGIPLAVAAVLTLLACLALLAGWRSDPAFWVALVFSALAAALALLHASREAMYRHASGDALVVAAARLSGLLDSAMDAIITLDERHRIVLYNRAAEKIFGWTSAQALGAQLEMLMPQRFRSGHGAHIRHFAATGTTTRRMGDGTVLYGLRATGEEFPMEASISQLETAEGKLFTVILRDVTERVRAQEELGIFAMQAHAIRESEKTRIARELHDELAQSLTALKMDAIWVLDKLPEGADACAAKLDEMLDLLDTTVAATRRIASDLRPLLLDDLGLVAAIEWLANSFSQRTGVACELRADEELELQEPYATAVFRILQESLANVGKHAKASRVNIRLERSADSVYLLVEDNGIGFDLKAPRKPQSLGLMGLHERAHLLKGSLAMSSRPGQGTRIEVRIPLAASQNPIEMPA